MAKHKPHHPEHPEDHPDHPQHAEHVHHHATLARKRRFNISSVAVLAVVMATLGVYFVYKSQAANDTLSVVPTSSTVSLGTSFSVTIHENSNTDAVNAVQANLTYDQTKLSCTNSSVDSSTSAFSLQAQQSCGNGVIHLARATAGTSGPITLTGDQIVAVINFTTINTGTASVAFGAGSAIIRASDTVNVLGATNPGSYTVADTAAPSVPTGLTSPSQTDTSVSLSWTASTDNVGVTGYKIFRNGVQAGTSATPSFTDTGRTPNTSYSYAVLATDAAGNASAQSSALAASTKPDTTKPSAPTGLTSPSQTVSTVSLAWTASTDDVAVSGYNILRNGAVAGTSTTPTFTDSGRVPNTSYSYTIQATDAAGNVSAASTALAVKTKPDTTKPSTPSGLASPAQTNVTIDLSWNASTDDVAVTGYKILRNGTQIATNTDTTFTDTGLVASTSYSYTVEATDAAGNVSAASTALVVSTKANPKKIGDANGDGVVDTIDLSILASHYGLSGQTFATGDFTGDGVVDVFDFSALAAHWHT